MSRETRALLSRSSGMRLAVIAAVVFIAGLWPGLSKSTGPVQEMPRMQAAAKPVHPVLVKVADLLRLRL